MRWRGLISLRGLGMGRERRVARWNSARGSGTEEWTDWIAMDSVAMDGAGDDEVEDSVAMKLAMGRLFDEVKMLVMIYEEERDSARSTARNSPLPLIPPSARLSPSPLARKFFP